MPAQEILKGLALPATPLEPQLHIFKTLKPLARARGCSVATRSPIRRKDRHLGLAHEIQRRMMARLGFALRCRSARRQRSRRQRSSNAPHGAAVIKIDLPAQMSHLRRIEREPAAPARAARHVSPSASTCRRPRGQRWPFAAFLKRRERTSRGRNSIGNLYLRALNMNSHARFPESPSQKCDSLLCKNNDVLFLFPPPAKKVIKPPRPGAGARC